ncbi:MAG: patatin-like phospholipase family protein [Pseudomonadota bacterium]
MADRTFELGLVMAGAISGGAYAAGVVDFLIQALDAWYAEKADGSTPILPHDVKLRVMSGASAGAMCTALAAVALNAKTEPVNDVTEPPDPSRNRLFHSWVEQIDISHLLGAQDLHPGEPVCSALDSTVLREIAMCGLKMDPLSKARPYVDDDLAVFLTVANLRGVPYGFGLEGDPGASRYGMLAHADHMRFKVTRSDGGDPLYDLLNPDKLCREGKVDENWRTLADAALASGAFPIGLQARELTRPVGQYKERLDFEGASSLPGADSAPYDFLCVDGGLMNNEPLELARRYLEGGDGQHGDSACTDAHRAVIMIDPFPNKVDLEKEDKLSDDVLIIASSMFNALVNQARFKPSELEIAGDTSDYSRFMIAPTLRNEQKKLIEPAMMASVLGGFGGFLAKAFRQHDFQLGRRNCQRFLSQHFALPEDNKEIFAGVDQETLKQFRIYDEENERHRFADDGTTHLIPIIPLCGDAKPRVAVPERPPTSVVNLDELSSDIRKRARRVAHQMIDTKVNGLAARLAAKGVYLCFGQSRLERLARSKINEALEKLR